MCLQYRRSWFDPWVRKIPWRGEWQLTSVFLPGESHEERSFVHGVANSQTGLTLNNSNNILLNLPVTVLYSLFTRWTPTQFSKSNPSSTNSSGAVYEAFVICSSAHTTRERCTQKDSKVWELSLSLHLGAKPAPWETQSAALMATDSLLCHSPFFSVLRNLKLGAGWLNAIWMDLHLGANKHSCCVG